MNKPNRILLLLSASLLAMSATVSFYELIGQTHGGKVVANIFTLLAFLINLYLAITEIAMK